MVDVLLTHSYHLAYDAKQLRKMQPYAPLGTLYAASALRAAGFSVAAFDAMLINPEENFAAVLERHQPRIVAVYEDDFNFLSKMCLTRMRDVVWDMAAACERRGIPFIVHGSDATDHPELFLESGADYVLRGESEETLLQLCTALLQGAEPGNVDGLIYRNAAGKLISGTQQLAKNPDWLHLPEAARDLIDFAPYREAWTEAHGYFSVNMVASRGCPYRCNWCAKPISQNKFHLRPAAVVADEMRYLKADVKADHIWFADDVFALNQHWIEDFAAEVTARDAALPFKIQSRADLMSESTVAALKAAGCAEVWMGVESGSQKILDAMDKGLKLSSVLTARERLAEAGIRTCYFLQFGYPGETWDDLQQTIALVRKTRPNDIGISFSYPLPNTVFYERVKAQLGAKRNWTDSDDLCIMFQATYATDFYRAVREALHAEVSSWWENHSDTQVEDLWRKVAALEPVSRNPEPSVLDRLPHTSSEARSSFLPLNQLFAATER